VIVGGVDLSLLSEFRQRFVGDAKNQLAQSVCVKHDLLDVLRVSQQELTPHVYNHKVHITALSVTSHPHTYYSPPTCT